MMRFQGMWDLFAALDGQGRSVAVDRIAARWDADSGNTVVINASTNVTAAFTVAGQRRIVRFIPAEARSKTAIETELAFVRYLISKGVVAAAPVPSSGKRWVERAESLMGPVFATAWTRIEGRCIEDSGEADEDVIHAWGMTLGRLHAATGNFNAPGRATWETLIHEAVQRFPPSEFAARKAAHLLLERMGRWPRNPGTYGLIHFDLEIDNLIFGEAGPSIIDFDDSAYCWFAADIAFALRQCFDDRISGINPSDPRVVCFLAGYREIRPILEDALESFPDFLALNHLHHLGNLVTSLAEWPEEEPAWASVIRGKLRRKVNGFRAELTRYIDTS